MKYRESALNSSLYFHLHWKHYPRTPFFLAHILTTTPCLFLQSTVVKLFFQNINPILAPNRLPQLKHFSEWNIIPEICPTSSCSYKILVTLFLSSLLVFLSLFSEIMHFLQFLKLTKFPHTSGSLSVLASTYNTAKETKSSSSFMSQLT